MDSKIMYKALKYIVCSVIVFLSLKFVIKNDMSLIDIVLLSVIAMLVFAVVENFCGLVTKDNKKVNNKEQSNCKAYCEMKEHMGNVSDNIHFDSPKPTTLSSATEYQKINNQSNQSENNNQISENEPSESYNDSEYEVMEEVLDEFAQTVEPKNYQDKKLSDYDRFQKRFAQIIEERKQKSKEFINKTGLIDRNEDESYRINVKRRSDDIKSVGMREKDGIKKDSDVQYDVRSYHVIPTVQNEGSFEYGYSMLPPKDWYPVPPFPPVCVSEKQCPVCPVLTTGTNADLKEWDSSRRITAPDEINVRYVEEKLNSGR